ncbi:PAS domain S-box protein [Mucilaginibacter robiniae]|uniref:histidine kinase n=1 Tax=Mucilaginibacter robiniae TaxID=2728022 RepID=A0A7L5E1T2_9SPHI|nr:PAS domain S-box protein [Mucilaginibacter robiniae]QJD96357.1 PAS domain S-box protein [Mucilaginibacter robiniae]
MTHLSNTLQLAANRLQHYLRLGWQHYQQFVADAIQADYPNHKEDIHYWRKKLFTCFVTYTLPVSLLAIIPGIWVGIRQGYGLVVCFGLTAIATVCLVALNKSLSLKFRKMFVVAMFYLLAIVLTITFGTLGPGILYLLALNLFITLTSSAKAAYWSVAVNVLVGAVFAFVIQFRLFATPLIQEYNTGSWIAVVSNLIFLSWVGVALVNYVLSGLEKTLTKEYILQDELQQEAVERQRRNEQLKESEGHYKSLFHSNPTPMWVFDEDTLQFLQVNEAAIESYGYSREEFLSMTIKEIRPVGDVDQFLTTLKQDLSTGMDFHAYCQHCRKNQQCFHVEVQCSTIPFNGKLCKLVIAHDITEQVNYTRAIEMHNKNLQEIAYIQSHVVRAPLARIMGLVDLLIQNAPEKADQEVLHHLESSANEFDEVIKTITYKTYNYNESDNIPEL